MIRRPRRLYTQLLADAAAVAGITVLPGFDPKVINVIRGGKKAPGLNLSLDPGDEPGHVGWVDASGTFVALDLTKGLPAVNVGMTIGVGAFNADKAMSMRTIRHEMVHARHKVKQLDAITKWHTGSARGAWRPG